MKALLSGFVVTSALGLAAPAMATPITFIGSGVSAQPDPISASASFSVVGNDLQIILTNTSTTNLHYNNPDVLEGLVFSTVGNLTLTPVSAALTAGSAMVGTLQAGTTLGDHWAYKFSSTGFSNGSFSTTDKYIIGAAGFSPILGQGNFGSNSKNVQGLDYGIVGADWNASTASNGTKNQEPFENDSITLLLSGIPTGFDPSSVILSVDFLYGTAPDSVLADVPVTTKLPEPLTVSLFGVGLAGAAAMRRRKAKTA